MKKCAVCGKEFTSRVGTQKCCSRFCSQIREKQKAAEYRAEHHKPKEQRKCVFCGELYEVKTPLQKFCSTACCDAYHHEIKRAQNPDNRDLNPQIKECPVCGAKFATTKQAKKYCSRACHDKALRKKIETEHRKEIMAGNVAKAEGKSAKTLSDWQREARECNLDYGTYRGLIATGKTYDELKVLYSEHTPPAHARSSKGSRAAMDNNYGQKAG